jgi:hypothetical protein
VYAVHLPQVIDRRVWQECTQFICQEMKTTEVAHLKIALCATPPLLWSPDVVSSSSSARMPRTLAIKRPVLWSRLVPSVWLWPEAPSPRRRFDPSSRAAPPPPPPPPDTLAMALRKASLATLRAAERTARKRQFQKCVCVCVCVCLCGCGWVGVWGVCVCGGGGGRGGGGGGRGGGGGGAGGARPPPPPTLFVACVLSMAIWQQANVRWVVQIREIQQEPYLLIPSPLLSERSLPRSSVLGSRPRCRQPGGGSRPSAPCVLPPSLLRLRTTTDETGPRRGATERAQSTAQLMWQRKWQRWWWWWWRRWRRRWGYVRVVSFLRRKGARTLFARAGDEIKQTKVSDLGSRVGDTHTKENVVAAAAALRMVVSHCACAA